MMINQWIYSRGPRFSAMTSPARVLYHIGLSCSAKHFISSGLGLPDFCRHESWLGNDMDWRGFFNVFFNTVIGLCWSENWVFLPNVWPFYGEKEFIIKFGSTYHISRHTNLEVGPCRAVNWLGQPTFAISNHIKPSISGKKKVDQWGWRVWPTHAVIGLIGTWKKSILTWDGSTKSFPRGPSLEPDVFEFSFGVWWFCYFEAMVIQNPFFSPPNESWASRCIRRENDQCLMILVFCTGCVTN